MSDIQVIVLAIVQGLTEFLPISSSGHLVLVPTPAYRDSGDFDLVDGLVRNSDVPELTYSGISMYRPEFFENCEPGRFSIVPIMRSAADAGRMQGSLYEGLWTDAGTQERLAALRNSVEG